jgi:SAM-dependent methyltransferase
MNPADTWAYKGGDACADFFSACLKAAAIDAPPNANVLEIGCAEFDWLTPAAVSWPQMTFSGIDWRGKASHHNPRVTRTKGDVMQPDAYAPESFDLIVSISAIEHVGLGHYEQDPKEPNGDTIAITNALRWLKPGGWLLFDVPYNPLAYSVQGTSHREYDDDAIWARLWVAPLAAAKASARWHATFYCHARNTTLLLKKPTVPAVPFYYISMAWQKVW